METVTIRQEIDFETSPMSVYNAIMNAKHHAAFTEAEAEVDNKEGGRFTAYDGYIVGENIQLKPGEKIIQNWRAITENWPEDHWSRIEFHISDNEEDGTRLIFVQKDLPKAVAESVANGWHKYYWKPMHSYFKEQGELT